MSKGDSRSFFIANNGSFRLAIYFRTIFLQVFHAIFQSPITSEKVGFYDLRETANSSKRKCVISSSVGWPWAGVFTI